MPSPPTVRFLRVRGENGNLWVGDTASARIIGSINLNGGTPVGRSTDRDRQSAELLRATFPGNLTLWRRRASSHAGRPGAGVFTIDTTKVVTGVNGTGQVLEPNNFAAVAGRVSAGRYPYAVEASPDGKRLFVGNVGIFQYAHLTPTNPTGNSNHDYPLGYPGTTYPDDMRNDKTIKIKKVDPRNLPDTLRDPEGIRVGYIDQDEIDYTIPGLGSPNAPESSSVYSFRLTASGALPVLEHIVKTGLRVGEVEQGIATFGGSHPNAIAVAPGAIFVSNGLNDTISILDRPSLRERARISLSVLDGFDSRLKGVQPVGLALSPDNRYLYVAEAGLNAVAVLRIDEDQDDARVIGHIPTGWRESACVSARMAARCRSRMQGPAATVPSPTRRRTTSGRPRRAPSGRSASFRCRTAASSGPTRSAC